MSEQTVVGRVSSVETVLHWFGWTGGCLYSTYRLGLIISNHSDRFTVSNTPGWLPGFRMDDADDELVVLFKKHLAPFMAFVTLHLVIGKCLRNLHMLRLLPLFHFVITSLYLWFSVGWGRYAMMLTVAAVFYPVTWARSRLICWVLFCLALFGHTSILHLFVGPDTTPEDEDCSYYVSCMYMWCLCRLVMVSCDFVDQHSSLDEHHNIVTYLGYIFYVPTFKGPLITHQNYVAVFTSNSRADDRPEADNIIKLIVNLVRVAFWFLMLEISNRLIHFHSLRYSPEDVAELFGRWEIAGLIYWSCQYFHMKYIVFYGFNSALAAFEGITVPSAPRCGSWITNSSDIWKYFDNGMYLFLRDYISAPLLGGRNASTLRRATASAVVFMFVYFWHGQLPYILLWTVVNYVCLIMERLAQQLAKTSVWREWERVIGPDMTRRCLAMLGAPLNMVAWISQTGFCTQSLELGLLAIREGLMPQSSQDLFVTLLFLYCGCQVADDIKRWRLQRARPNKEPYKTS